MPAPTNLTADTAINLGSLPAHVTQDVRDAGTTYTVWYSYTAVAGDVVIGIHAYGDLTIYKPFLSIKQDLFGTPVLQNIGGFPNVSCQIPVVVGTTYYIQCGAPNPAATPALLTLDVQRAPISTAQQGDLFVNDDAFAFPAAVLSPSVDYAVRRFVVYPPLEAPADRGFDSGEQGDILPNGHMLIADFGNDQIHCYDQTFARLTSPALSGARVIRANRGANNFYVGVFTAPLTVRIVDANGVLSPTVHTLTGIPTLGALAANAAETILYHAENTFSANSAIRRWNLTTDVAMTDLAATVANYVIDDLLVLPDDSILAIYVKGSATTDVFVRHYSAAGALLQTYAFGETNPNPTFAHIAYAIDPDTFWVWTHPVGGGLGTSRYQNVRISDGAVLSTVTHAEYEIGYYWNGTMPAATLAPPARFGNSASCPFFILTQNESVTVPLPPLPAACPASAFTSSSSLPTACPAPSFA